MRLLLTTPLTMRQCRLKYKHFVWLVLFLVLFFYSWFITVSFVKTSQVIKEAAVGNIPSTLEHATLLTKNVSTDVSHTQHISQHPDMNIRGKWQQKQIAEFCNVHGLSKLNNTLMLEQPSKTEFFRHVIVDDSTKNLFCFMPKVGCTTIRTTLLVLKGILPKSTLRLHRRKDILEQKLEIGLKRSSFLKHSLTDTSRIWRMKNYRKYTIVRHPLERLLSAYIDKLSGPILKVIIPYNYFEHLKHEIVKMYNTIDYQQWNHSNHKSLLEVSFPQFVHWISNKDLDSINEHFMPQYYNCQPCHMNYHFYGSFNNFQFDSTQILRQFAKDFPTYPQENYVRQGKSTSQKMFFYYSQLPTYLKHLLYQKFILEFDFYHYLYPLEQSLTQQLLELPNL